MLKNTAELRVFLLEQMEGVANETVKTDVAKGICNLSQQVYNTLNIEVKTALAKNRLGDDQVITSVKFDDE